MKCRAIVGGTGEGEALVTRQPINFLAMIDPTSGDVTDESHELHGRKIADKILIFPNAIGSSVGAYSIYALRINGVAPRAVICGRADITTASGCAIACIPLVDKAEGEIFSVRAGSRVRVDAGKSTIEVVDS